MQYPCTKVYWIWVNNNWAVLVYVFIKPTYPTSDVTTFAESAVYILYIFANNFGTKRDSLLQ